MFIKKVSKSEKLIENEKIKWVYLFGSYGHMVRQRVIIHELLKKSRSIEITV